ncbi:MAG: DUF1667 domain-containing protein [Clostridia bacterium]
METICIMCPVGCKLKVEKDTTTKKIVVTGNSCPRGEIYGKNELTNPKRTVTSTIKSTNGYVSVKTTEPVPKNKIFDVIKLLKSAKIKNYKVNDIVATNVCGTKSNIVVTGENDLT